MPYMPIHAHASGENLGILNPPPLPVNGFNVPAPHVLRRQRHQVLLSGTLLASLRGTTSIP